MTAISAQQAVADFHREAAQGHHGHDMYLFHRDWHQTNPDPIPPAAPDPSWGVGLPFGRNFLQMHHEMVKVADGEPKLFMMHPSLVSWYVAKGYDLPPEWDPLTRIPAVLAYAPDPSVYPQEIQDAVAEAASREGKSPQEWLTRDNEDPRFALPKYFTRDGVGDAEEGEPYTGARKLADFKNVNQLGCCLVFPHNAWHGAIGGAMRSTWTAIADPIFYFGVHWQVDKVFDEYKRIQAEWALHGFNPAALRAIGALPTQKVKVPKKFTAEQLARREEDIATSRRLREPPHGHFRKAPVPRAVTGFVKPRPRGARGGAARPAPAAAARPARPGIQALMAVPPEEHDKAWLMTALQRAIELELFTIPPYLTAYWSIDDQDHDVAALIHDVAVEEMFHMALACNMLSTLGGTPEIATKDAAPHYPGPLPGGVHPELTNVTPQALSKDLVLNVFMKIEEPGWAPLVTGLAAGVTYKTIGAFYQAVLDAFGKLDDQSDFKKRPQLTRGSRLFAIGSRADAEKAINLIRLQGEGTPQTPEQADGEPAHYYEFGQIWHEKKVAVKNGQWVYDPAAPFPFPPTIYPMAPVPEGGYTKAADFDGQYSDLLRALESAWGAADAATGQQRLTSAISLMYGLADPARALMQVPIPGGGGNFGPSFQFLPAAPA
jgi:hypothetical protein